jgi:hypothetical protein
LKNKDWSCTFSFIWTKKFYFFQESYNNLSFSGRTIRSVSEPYYPSNRALYGCNFTVYGLILLCPEKSLYRRLYTVKMQPYTDRIVRPGCSGCSKKYLDEILTVNLVVFHPHVLRIFRMEMFSVIRRNSNKYLLLLYQVFINQHNWFFCVLLKIRIKISITITVNAFFFAILT